VLPGQRLQVREPELPPAAERAVLEAEEGTDALAVTFDATGKPTEIWVRWHEVTDFYGSGPRDRHYVIDRLTGEIRLGDGRSGLVPPVGAALRLAPYQTGGGSAGNRRAGVVVQLKTTVPYVDKVTNPEPATGGADAEALPLLLARAPRTVRHGGRAVTLEDYEDLALLASPEVARARCVPLADLAADPLAVAGGTAGQVSVIVVPRSSDVKPLPSLELIRRVQEFLDGVRVPTARLSVVGPLYVQVDIEATVAVRSLESATTVLAAVQQTVRAFLHPLTGGLGQEGWDFGRQPHASDVYALIEAVPGVDHVSFLKVDVVDPLHAIDTGRFLVHAGVQKVGVVVEED
jgi:predicted phage baseplate assembly protein